MMNQFLVFIIIFLVISCSTKNNSEEFGFKDLADNGNYNHDLVHIDLAYFEIDYHINGKLSVVSNNQSYRFFLDSTELINNSNIFEYEINSKEQYPQGEKTISVVEENEIKGKINLTFPNAEDINILILDTNWKGTSNSIEEIPIRFTSKIESDYKISLQLGAYSNSCSIQINGTINCNGNEIELYGAYNGIDSLYLINLPTYTQTLQPWIKNKLTKSFENVDIEFDYFHQKNQIYRDTIRE